MERSSGASASASTPSPHPFAPVAQRSVAHLVGGASRCQRSIRQICHVAGAQGRAAAILQFAQGKWAGYLQLPSRQLGQGPCLHSHSYASPAPAQPQPSLPAGFVLPGPARCRPPRSSRWLPAAEAAPCSLTPCTWGWAGTEALSHWPAAPAQAGGGGQPHAGVHPSQYSMAECWHRAAVQRPALEDTAQGTTMRGRPRTSAPGCPMQRTSTSALPPGGSST